MARSGVVDKMLSDDAIEDIVRAMNGSRAIRTGVEHDPMLLPLGKVARGAVVPDGDHLVTVAQIIYADYGRLVTGKSQGADSRLVLSNFEEDVRPFVVQSDLERVVSNRVSISADPAHFYGYDQFLRFKSDVESVENAIVKPKGRKSLVPEPLLEFTLQPRNSAGGLILYWLGRRALKVLTETADMALRETITVPLAACLSDAIRAPFRIYKESKSVDHRDIVVVAHILVDCEITLVFRVAPHEDILSFDLTQLIACKDEIGDWLEQASSATFAYENGAWSFCYLINHDGKVLGSSDVLTKTIAAFNATRKRSTLLVRTESGDLKFQECTLNEESLEGN